MPPAGLGKRCSPPCPPSSSAVTFRPGHGPERAGRPRRPGPHQYRCSVPRADVAASEQLVPDLIEVWNPSVAGSSWPATCTSVPMRMPRPSGSPPSWPERCRPGPDGRRRPCRDRSSCSAAVATIRAVPAGPPSSRRRARRVRRRSGSPSRRAAGEPQRRARLAPGGDAALQTQLHAQVAIAADLVISTAAANAACASRAPGTSWTIDTSADRATRARRRWVTTSCTEILPVTRRRGAEWLDGLELLVDGEATAFVGSRLTYRRLARRALTLHRYGSC